MESQRHAALLAMREHINAEVRESRCLVRQRVGLFLQAGGSGDAHVCSGNVLAIERYFSQGQSGEHVTSEIGCVGTRRQPEPEKE